MLEEFVGWPEIAAALETLPPGFAVTLNDLLRTSRQCGSNLKFVRHNAKRSGRPLFRRRDLILYFANRWRHAPEIHERFATALRKYAPEMRRG